MERSEERKEISDIRFGETSARYTRARVARGGIIKVMIGGGESVW